MQTFRKVFGLIIITGLAVLFFNNNLSYAAFKLSPEAENLYKQWSELIDFSSVDYVKENDPAPEIKAGLVITPQNAKDYPGLKKVLPETIYRRLDPDCFLPIETMTIVDTRPRYFSQAAIDATRKFYKTVRLNKETLAMEGYKAGIPFPFVTDPLHIVWNHVMGINHYTDNAWFDPIAATTYSKARKPDSMWKANFGAWVVQGRLYSDVGPNHESGFFKGHAEIDRRTMLTTYPQDLRGTAFLRIKYFDVAKQDYFVSYLPGLKRIRILSGSDAQDPIIGSELSWDMWGIESQKQPSKTIFPNAYKILDKRIFLQPTYPPRPSTEIHGEQFVAKWEKRPVWLLEILSLDPTYVYSKRIMYADMEIFKAIYEEYYDRRGELCRAYIDYKYMLPNGFSTWEGVSVLNWITQRHSVFKMNSVPNPPLKAEHFDMRWLVRMAR